MNTDEALERVELERTKQIIKWGDQSDHEQAEWGIILGEEFGEVIRLANEVHFRADEHWADDRLSTMVDCLRDELAQTAAVCVAWLEALDES